MAIWSKREQTLIDGAKEIAATLNRAPYEQWNATKESSAYFFKLAAQKGLTGIEVSELWGGSGASYQCKAQITQILAGADFGFAMSVVNTHNVIHNMTQWMDKKPGDPAISGLVAELLSADKIACTALTEPHAGSDFSSITTMATSHDRGWRIDGEKSWIINASIADLILVYAQGRLPD